MVSCYQLQMKYFEYLYTFCLEAKRHFSNCKEKIFHCCVSTYTCIYCFCLFQTFPLFAGMLPVLLIAGLILALSIPGTKCESATLRFLGQTEFVVNETSTAVVRLVVERVGDPINVTALVLVSLDYSLWFSLEYHI